MTSAVKTKLNLNKFNFRRKSFGCYRNIVNLYLKIKLISKVEIIICDGFYEKLYYFVDFNFMLKEVKGSLVP